MHRDGAPVSRDDVARLLSPLSHHGPDGSTVRVSGSIGFGYQAFWTTPEEADEHQPIADASGRFLLLFDGRLDNRDELLAAIEVAHSDTLLLSDAAVVLRGVERWGQTVWARLLGPFAACLVDTLEKRIWLARDHLGERALVYHASPWLLVAASEEGAVLAHPCVSRALDETSLARYFAIHSPLAGATMFAAVKEVLPAEVLEVTQDHTATYRYWEPDQEPRFGRSEHEWVEEYKQLLTDSVRARLRATGAPAALLSGGLDSGSVVALAATDNLARGRPPLRTISWVFDELSECDERRWITQVVRRFGCDSVLFAGDSYWPLCDSPSWQGTAGHPEVNAYRPLKQRAYSEASGRGHRVLLVGASGDLLYSRWQPAFAHLLREGHLSTLARELVVTRRIWGLAGIRKHGSVRYFGRLLRDGLAPWRRTGSPPTPAWLSRAAAKLVADSFELEASDGRAGNGCHPAVCTATAWGGSREVQHGARAGVDLRDPYRDRRVVELVLRMPASLMLRNGRLKHLVRAAMVGTLPEEVRLRTHPTPLSPLYRRGLAERAREAACTHLQQGKSRWGVYVRPETVKKILTQDLPAGRSDPESLVPWYCIVLRLWYLSYGL